ncbi:MAG: glycosyltransferase family 4 protein [Acidimicrobiales bacterium]
MRVAQVCPYSLSVPGGVQSQVLGLARALRSLGHEARVLAPCDSAPPDESVIPLGSSVPLASNGSVAPVAPDPACVSRTLWALAGERFDVVHLHEPMVPGPTLAALLVSDLPIVGTFHRNGPSRVYWVLRPLAPWASRRLDLRCAVSADAATTARAALGGNYTVVPNGVEIARFAKAAPWPTKGPTVVFVGRHEPRKGLEVLIEAFSRLPPDTHLWVVGNGPQSTALRRATAGQERIEWLGRVSEEEKASRLKGADVYAAPSIHGESFGVVLLEAMAAGTPVVATDLPGYRMVARNGADAILVRPGDASDLTAALASVLTDRGRAEGLAAAGSDRAAALSVERTAESYVSLYHDLLDSGAGGEARLMRLHPGRLARSGVEMVRPSGRGRAAARRPSSRP